MKIVAFLSRLLWRSLLTLLLIVILLPPLLLIAIGSESGSRWLLDRAVSLSDEQLTIAAVEGSLLGQLELRQLRFDDGELWLEVERLRLHWHPFELLERRLRIASLELEGVVVVVPAGEEEKADHPLQLPEALDLPVTVQLDALLLRRLTVLEARDGEPLLELDTLELALHSDAEGLHLSQLAVTAPQFGAAVNGHLGLAQPFPHTLEFTWWLDHPEWEPFGALRGGGRVSGDLATLQIGHQLTAPLLLTTEGVLIEPLGALRWELHNHWEELVWEGSPEQPPLILRNGVITGDGSREAAAIAVQVEHHGMGLPEGRWQAQVHASPEQLLLKSLRGEILGGVLRLEGAVALQPALEAAITFSGEGFDLELLALESLEPLAGERLNLRGGVRFADGLNGAKQRLTLEPFTLALAEGGGEITVSGEVVSGSVTPEVSPWSLASGPQADLEVAWQGLRWPLTGALEETLLQSGGRLHLVGGLEAYTLQLATTLAGTALPAGRWELQGSGSASGFAVTQLEGETLGGVVALRGDLAWSPQLRWGLELEGSDLDPAQLWPELPGRIALAVRSEGVLADTSERGFGFQEMASRVRLSGELSGYPLVLEGELRATPEGYLLDHFWLDSGANRATASGAMRGDQLTASWQLQLPALAALLPEMEGSLVGAGRVEGALESPKVYATLRGEGLRWQEYRLGRLALDLDLDPLGKEELRVVLEAGPLWQGEEERVAGLALHADGVIGNHRITLEGEMDKQHRMALELGGGFDLEALRWQGRLVRLEVATADFAQWQMVGSAGLLLEEQRLSLERLCLDGQLGEASEERSVLCTAAEWSATHGAHLQTEVQRLPLHWLHPTVSGEVSATLEGRLAADATPSGTLALTITPGLLQIPTEGGEQQLPHQGGRLNAQLDGRGLQGELRLELLEQSSVVAEWALPGLATLPPSPQQLLRATLRVELADLGLLPAFVPMVSESGGQINADLTLGGTLETPQLGGVLRGEGITLTLPEIGITLTEGTLDAATDREDPMRWQLAARLRSGEGLLTLQGGVDATTQQLDLHIQGERFQVIRTPDVEAMISPNLQLRASPEQLHLRGLLAIPAASITPQISYSGLVGSTLAATASDAPLLLPSADVVILEPDGSLPSETGLEKIESLIALDSDIELRLGSRVFIDTVGFRSRLDGSLRLRHDPKSRDLIPMASGELRIVDGSYRSLGQNLEIHEGRLLFSRVPLTKPELDVRAIRRIYNDPQVDLAGLHITGNPEKLDMRVFSEPDLDQSTVMAYLLTGTAPDTRQQILGVGTYLRPDLYVGYDLDLIDNSGAFNVRYHIRYNLAVEAQIGESDNVVTFSYVLER